MHPNLWSSNFKFVHKLKLLPAQYQLLFQVLYTFKKIPLIFGFKLHFQSNSKTEPEISSNQSAYKTQVHQTNKNAEKECLYHHTHHHSCCYRTTAGDVGAYRRHEKRPSSRTRPKSPESSRPGEALSPPPRFRRHFPPHPPPPRRRSIY